MLSQCTGLSYNYIKYIKIVEKPVFVRRRAFIGLDLLNVS